MLRFKLTASAATILSGIEMIHMMPKRQARYVYNPAPSLAGQLKSSLTEYRIWSIRSSRWRVCDKATLSAWFGLRMGTEETKRRRSARCDRGTTADLSSLSLSSELQTVSGLYPFDPAGRRLR